MSTSEIQANWSCDAATETSFEVYYDKTVGGSGWSLGRTTSADATDGTVTGLDAATEYKFKVRAINTYTNSDYSGEVTATTLNHYTDSVSDTVTATDSISVINVFLYNLGDSVSVSDGVTDSCSFVDSIDDSVSLSDAVTTVVSFVDSVSDTVTTTDVIADSQSIRMDYDYYWGSTSGYVYRNGEDLLSDASAAITSTWTSKTIDFAEDNSDNTGRWKTVYKMEYVYKEDDTDVPTTISISNDGGVTWTAQTKYIGDYGDGRIEHAHWFWNKTGQFFIVKVVWSSSDKEFQFLGFDMIYDDQGEQFEVS